MQSDDSDISPISGSQQRPSRPSQPSQPSQPGSDSRRPPYDTPVQLPRPAVTQPSQARCTSADFRQTSRRRPQSTSSLTSINSQPAIATAAGPTQDTMRRRPGRTMTVCVNCRDGHAGCDLGQPACSRCVEKDWSCVYVHTSTELEKVDRRRVKKRNRKTKTCEECRKRKRRCNKLHPRCDQCDLHDLVCSYKPYPHKEEHKSASLTDSSDSIESPNTYGEPSGHGDPSLESPPMASRRPATQTEQTRQGFRDIRGAPIMSYGFPGQPHTGQTYPSIPYISPQPTSQPTYQWPAQARYLPWPQRPQPQMTPLPSLSQAFGPVPVPQNQPRQLGPYLTGGEVEYSPQQWYSYQQRAQEECNRLDEYHRQQAIERYNRQVDGLLPPPAYPSSLHTGHQQPRTRRNTTVGTNRQAPSQSQQPMQPPRQGPTTRSQGPQQPHPHLNNEYEMTLHQHRLAQQAGRSLRTQVATDSPYQGWGPSDSPGAQRPENQSDEHTGRQADRQPSSRPRQPYQPADRQTHRAHPATRQSRPGSARTRSQTQNQTNSNNAEGEVEELASNSHQPTSQQGGYAGDQAPHLASNYDPAYYLAQFKDPPAKH